MIDGAAAARFNAYLGPGRCARLPPRRALTCIMTTVVVVRKGGQIAMAADTLVTFGDTRLAHRLRGQQQDIQGRTMRRPELSSAWPARRRTFRCCGRRWLRMPRESLQASAARTRCSTPSPSCIRYLKDNFFLQTKEEDSDPYESQPVQRADRQRQRHLRPLQLPRSVRVQASSGASAPAAALRSARCMRSTTRRKTAREVAEAGVAAGCEFDRNSAASGRRVSHIKLKDVQMSDMA